MGANHGAGALAVEVEVAGEELGGGPAELVAVARVDRAGKPVLGGVGEFERVAEVLGPGDGEHGTEDLLFENDCIHGHVGNDGGPEEVAVAPLARSARDQPAFGLADLDVAPDGFAGTLADDRPHVVLRVLRRSDRDRLDLLPQLLQELVVDGRIDDGPRARRALLALVAERRGQHAACGLIEIRLAVYDDGALAAHLRNHALDPDLARLRFRRQLVDPQPDVFRAGEGDEARPGMLDQRIAHHRAAARQQREAAGGEAGLDQHFGEPGCHRRRVARRLHDDGVARDQRGGGHARENRQRKIPRRDDDTHPQRQVNQFVLFAGHLVEGRRRGQTQHLSRVELAKVDGLGDIGLGFDPGLAGLMDQPGVELHLAPAQDCGRAEQHGDTFGRRSGAPLREEGVGLLDRAARQFEGRSLMNSDDFGGMRRVQRLQLGGRPDALSTDQERVLPAELDADLGQSELHCRALFGNREIGIDLVLEGCEALGPPCGSRGHGSLQILAAAFRPASNAPAAPAAIVAPLR